MVGKAQPKPSDADIFRRHDRFIMDSANNRRQNVSFGKQNSYFAGIGQTSGQGSTQTPDHVIEYGAFVIASSITVNFDNAYVNMPVPHAAYVADDGITPAAGITINSIKLVKTTGKYTGAIISVGGTIPNPVAGHFISFSAICKL